MICQRKIKVVTQRSSGSDTQPACGCHAVVGQHQFVVHPVIGNNIAVHAEVASNPGANHVGLTCGDQNKVIRTPPSAAVVSVFVPFMQGLTVPQVINCTIDCNLGHAVGLSAGQKCIEGSKTCVGLMFYRQNCVGQIGHVDVAQQNNAAVVADIGIAVLLKDLGLCHQF